MTFSLSDGQINLEELSDERLVQMVGEQVFPMVLGNGTGSNAIEFPAGILH